ncbi:MAG: response regulator [Pyrinomonadaceae bacterium]
MTRKILLVDDDKDLHELIGVALMREGYETLHAHNAVEGLELVSRGNPDLAILDIMMPGMDGLEMLSRLRQSHSDMPVIMMTAMSTPETAVAAMRDQACDFIAKPFDLKKLLSAVAAVFEMIPQEISIEVLSARPEWIELRVPCTPAALDPLERLMTQLKTDLPEETRRNVTHAFREMLQNAIEHGGKNDPSQYVEVGYVRSPRMILYRIKDPGEGFRLDALYTEAGPVAAVLNPEGDPTRHARVREHLGMRSGGFGILIASRQVDEMIYNGRHNEVLLIKYLDGEQTGAADPEAQP